MKKEIIKVELNMITRGAMALALIFVFFSLFKGVTNILNAFLVPLTLYLCCCIAFLLIKLREKKVNTLLSTLVLTITVSLSFWIAIMLTDYFFLTHMNNIIIKVLRGNIFAYAIMLIIEGALVGISQLFISRMFYKRLLTIQ